LFFKPKRHSMKHVFLIGILSSLLIGCNTDKPAEQKEEAAATTAAKTQPAEFADAKYSEVGKKSLSSLAKGDVDGWVADYADNAVFMWNGGDSLVGKPAITAYWKKRRAEVIDSLSFSDEIYLPVKVNQPQSVEAPGVWLLSWARVDAKYKSGKKMNQLIHHVMHFNDQDKIDRVIQYIDRSVINAATAK
jgi:ketosteroid isomerase-like protein